MGLAFKSSDITVNVYLVELDWIRTYKFSVRIVVKTQEMKKISAKIHHTLFYFLKAHNDFMRLEECQN